MDAIELEHYLIIAIGGLVSALVVMWHHGNRERAKKDAAILKITQEYAEQNREMAVEATRAFSGVQTSIDNNTKVIERLLDRDENTSRRR